VRSVNQLKWGKCQLKIERVNSTFKLQVTVLLFRPVPGSPSSTITASKSANKQRPNRPRRTEQKFRLKCPEQAAGSRPKARRRAGRSVYLFRLIFIYLKSPPTPDPNNNNNAIFIKDFKSRNGTFINSERLILKGVESDPYEQDEGRRREQPFALFLFRDSNDLFLSRNLESTLSARTTKPFIPKSLLVPLHSLRTRPLSCRSCGTTTKFYIRHTFQSQQLQQLRIQLERWP
jgi:hypothetical protein